jgi:penicillin-binding protein 1A
MQKKHTKKHKFIKNFILFSLGIVFLIIGLVAIWVSRLNLPDFRSFDDRRVVSSTKIFDRTGEILLYDVYKDVKRTPVNYEDISINIKNATVAIEDSEFWNHRGIRIKSII